VSWDWYLGFVGDGALGAIEEFMMTKQIQKRRRRSGYYPWRLDLEAGRRVRCAYLSNGMHSVSYPAFPYPSKTRCASSQAPAWEFRRRSSSFARQEARASTTGFPSWSLGTSETRFHTLTLIDSCTLLLPCVIWVKNIRVIYLGQRHAQKRAYYL